MNNNVLIEITESGPHIFIDGQELRNVYSLKLERTAMKSCELTIQFDSEKVKVVFADGWKGKKIAAIVGR